MAESSKMKPVFIVMQVSVVVGTLVTMLYLGRPVYWDIMARTGTSMEESRKDLHPAAGSQRPSIRSVWRKPIWQVPIKGSKIPSHKAFVLTKEMVECRAKSNIIIVTFGNYAFMDFILNWVKHLTDMGIQNLLVGAMDTKLVNSLYWKGIPVFDMGSNMNTNDAGWGTPTFHKMGREKVYLINVFLPFGYELLLCDTDMVWLKDPLPYFARFPAADILTSSDQLLPTVPDDRLEAWEKGATVLLLEQSFCLYSNGVFLPK